MKKLFYLILLLFFAFSCAKANDPVKETSTDMGYEITNIYSTNGIAQDVAIGTDKIYIAEDQYGFSIYDKSTAEQITQVDSFSSNYYSAVRLISLCENTNTLWIYNKYNTTSLHHYDISDINSPNLLGQMIGEVGGITNMHIIDGPEGTTVSYLRDSGIFTIGQIVDYSFWAYPTTIQDAINFSEDDEYVYVAGDQRGIFILQKVPDNAALFLGQGDTPGQAYDVAVQGNYAYVADKHMGLSVLDISDKSNPQFVYNYSDTWGHARSVVANDKIVAIGSGGGGIYVFSIEDDPAQPKKVAQITSDEIGYNAGVKIDNGVLYAISRDLGIVQIELDYDSQTK